MPRLSSEQLHSLRNDLNIDRLVIELLQIPTQNINGLRRFQCPLCGRFHTATHPTTNLARCFDCRKNFNTLELVMAVRQCRFLEAVAYLQKHQRLLIHEPRPFRPQPALPKAQVTPNPDPELTPTHACEVGTKRDPHNYTLTTVRSHLTAMKKILNRR
jgi:hypothetical protein